MIAPSDPRHLEREEPHDQPEERVRHGPDRTRARWASAHTLPLAGRAGPKGIVTASWPIRPRPARCSTFPPREGARRALRRRRLRALPGRRRVRDLVLGRHARRDLDFATTRAPAPTTTGPARLGRPSLPGRGAVRHGRRDARASGSGDHHLPPGGLRGGAPQALGHLRQGPGDRPVPPGLHDQRDGGAAARRRVRRPLRRRAATSPRRSSTRRWTPRSRSPTIRCGCCARRGSWPSSTWRPTQRVVRAMRAMRERLEIVSAERIRDELDKLLVARRPRRAGAARRDRVSDGFLPELLGAAARTGPRAPAQGRAAPHLRRRRAQRARPDAPPRGAAPRRRQAAHARDHRRRRAVPPPRDGGRAHGGASACANCATPTT